MWAFSPKSLLSISEIRNLALALTVDGQGQQSQDTMGMRGLFRLQQRERIFPFQGL